MLRTLGWNIADYFIRRSERKHTVKHFFGKESEAAVAGPVIVRAGKVLACNDPTGAEFYEDWLPYATSCCLCGEEILPGDAVVLHDIHELELAKKATLVGADKAAGCLRANCAPQQKVDGYWTKSGYTPEHAFSGV